MDIQKAQKIHIVGVGGAGTSAIAKKFLHEGKEVSGTDIKKSETTKWLKEKGAKVSIGHDKNKLEKDTDLVVHTLATDIDENAELKKAKEKGIPILSYPEVLGEISKNKFTIAISGTHGKTTTTAMLAESMIELGCNPTVIIGGGLKKHDTNFLPGKDETFIVEACEYKNAFLSIEPDILIITNIEKEHLDFFDGIEEIKQSFHKLAKKVPKDGTVVIDKKHKNVKKITKNIDSKILDYNKIDQPELKIPGEFNIKNAQAALGAIKAIDLPLQKARKIISKFEGSKRRSEYKGKTKNNTKVYDDYAHHPTEIKKTIKAFKEKFPQKRLLVVFQPHLYSRTKDFLKDFSKSFSKADEVILTDIYEARESEKNNKGVTVKKLLEKTQEERVNVKYKPNFQKIKEYILKQKNKNDVVLTMGAGDIYKLSSKIIKN